MSDSKNAVSIVFGKIVIEIRLILWKIRYVSDEMLRNGSA